MAPAPDRYRKPTAITTALGLLAVCLLVVATAFFVAAEFALVAADRNKVSKLADAGDRRARTVEVLLRRLNFHLSGAQLGITLTSLLLGFVAEPVIAELLHPLIGSFMPERATTAVSLVVALALATFLAMVLGELVPKTLAIADPERAALRLATSVRVYGLVFGPVISLLNWAANWLVRRLGIEPREELFSVRSLSELTTVVQRSAEVGTMAGSASRLFTRSVRFAHKSAADILIPRVAVDAVARDDMLQDVVRAAGSSGHSRFPVYGNDLDDIVGLVHVRQVHEVPFELRAETTVASVMREVVAVPETRDLQSLLIQMRNDRVQLVVVVDEYGGTSGIVTLEDLIEEIVGEIDDEYDPLTPSLIRQLGAGSFVVSGSLHLDEVLEATGFEMPDGAYETLAGFVLDRLGHVPGPGESLQLDGWRLVVEEMDRRRITRVRVEKAGSDAGGEQAP